MIRQDWSTLKKLMFMKTAAGGGAAVEATATGNPLTFVTDLARPLKSLLIPFTPIQSGTGDPSPQNIRSVIPWNGLTVFGGGKNLLDPSRRNAQGNNVQYYRSGNRYLLKGGQTYTISSNAIPAQINIFKGTNTTVATINSATLTYTPTENVEVWFDIYVPNSRLPEGGIHDVYGMLEVRETATAYEPYKPITDIDIVFPSPVYGGEHEAVSGRQIVTWGAKIFDGSADEGWERRPQGSASAFAMKATISGIKDIGNVTSIKANYLKTLSANETWGNYDNWISQIGDIIVTGIQSITTVEAWTAYLAENPLIVVYEFATPQEQTLTGHQITALVGYNTIWSDADGSMTATYLKKG